MVPRSAFSREYRAFCRLLRECRLEQELTQKELAQRLGRPQSFVSKYEVGERRLDVVELLQVCRGLGFTLNGFAGRLEKALDSSRKRRTARVKGRSIR